MKKLLLALALFLLPASVFAINITVPSAPGAGYVLVSTTTGAYIPVATTSPALSIGCALGSYNPCTATFFVGTSTTATNKFGNATIQGGGTTVYSSNGPTTFSAGGIGSAILQAPSSVYLRPSTTGNLIIDTGASWTAVLTSNGQFQFGGDFEVDSDNMNLIAGTNFDVHSGGSNTLYNDTYGTLMGLDGGGGATMRAQGDVAGVYAAPDGNTHIGYYSNGTQLTVDPTGNTITATGLPQMGGDPGTGANGWISTSNGGGGLFFDFVSGGETDYSALRISQFGVGSGLEFGIAGVDGQFHTDAFMGDAVFKGNVGGTNNFRFGPGSGDSAFAILANNNVLVNGATSVGSGVFQVTGKGYFSDNLGIGTSTPTSKLSVSVAAQQSASIQLFTIASTTNATLFAVNGAGAVITGGGLPVLSSCGTSPTITGNDNAGTVTTGTGVLTACTITFKTPKTTSPKIFIQTEGATALASTISAKSTAAFTVTFSATFTSGTFDYWVVQ